MRIFLIGYMGCGKSTLGRKLAEKLGYEFIDMDHYIEKRNYKTIPLIFEEEGEVSFRKKENKALLELSEFTNVVIATGGGAPCFYNNMEIMNQCGKTVFMNISPEILANRLLKSKTERPLIKGKSREELIAYIDHTLKERCKFYEKASFVISEPDFDPEQLISMLM